MDAKTHMTNQHIFRHGFLPFKANDNVFNKSVCVQPKAENMQGLTSSGK